MRRTLARSPGAASIKFSNCGGWGSVSRARDGAQLEGRVHTRLDVSVDEAAGMHVLQSFKNLSPQVERLSVRQAGGQQKECLRPECGQQGVGRAGLKIVRVSRSL